MNRLEQLLQFHSENPGDPFIRYCLALEYDKNGNADEALRYFEELISTNEQYTATYYHLGKLYEKLKRKDDAEKIYSKGLQITQSLKDMHAYSELLNAKNELVNDYDVEFDN